MEEVMEVAHWPGQSTIVCPQHKLKLQNVARFMGMPPVTCTPAPEGSVCANCENEMRAGKL